MNFYKGLWDNHKKEKEEKKKKKKEKPKGRTRFLYDDDDYYSSGRKTIGFNSDTYSDRSSSKYDYGYGSSYKGNTYGSYYYGGSSYNYSSYWSGYGYSKTEVEKEDRTLYIKPSSSYVTPSQDIISRKSYHYNLPQDAVKIIKELSRFFYYASIDDFDDMVEKKYTDESKLSPSELENVLKKKEFYEKLKKVTVRGSTPLEKALTIFSEMNNKNGKPPTELQELTDEIINRIRLDDDIQYDPIYNELTELDLLKRGFNKDEVFHKLSLIKNLGSKFKIEKEIEEKDVAQSNIHSVKMMKNYSDLPSIELYQRLLPNFKQKFYTKSLIRRSPIEKTEHKQKIIMLVDFSGSMASTPKQEWVLAILYDRIRMAIKEECEIFFSYFLTDMHQFKFTHIYDRKTALEFLSTFSSHPHGGDTSVGLVINQINSEITEKKRLHNLNIDLSVEKPEILIINDGQDTIKTQGFSYKTNAINLYQDNQQVREHCIKNNGLHVFVDEHNLKITE